MQSARRRRKARRIAEQVAALGSARAARACRGAKARAERHKGLGLSKAPEGRADAPARPEARVAASAGGRRVSMRARAKRLRGVRRAARALTGPSAWCEPLGRLKGVGRRKGAGIAVAWRARRGATAGSSLLRAFNLIFPNQRLADSSLPSRAAAPLASSGRRTAAPAARRTKRCAQRWRARNAAATNTRGSLRRMPWRRLWSAFCAETSCRRA